MENTEKQYIKTSLNLKKDLLLKMKLYAASSGKTVTQVIHEALEEYLKKHEEEMKQKFSSVVKNE